jgi:hypothetical protein
MGNNEKVISIAVIVHIKKVERCQIHSLLLCLKEVDKDYQIKIKIRRKNEIIKMRAEINEMETKNNTKYE